MPTPSFNIPGISGTLPLVTLDFSTGVLDPRISFSRAAATATVVNSSGFIESSPANAARLDYDPVLLTCKGLLIEEQRTNLLTFSEQFSNAFWVKTRSSVTADALNSPSNTLTADKLVEDTTASNSHFMQCSVSLGGSVDSSTYCISVFAKAGERTRFQFFDNAQNTSGNTFFDLSSGTIVSGTGTIQSYGNGWYRCTIFPVKNLSTTSNPTLRMVQSGTTIIYTGDGVSGTYFWGGQLEAASFATSYIPTTTTSVVRNADVATMTGTNFSSWWKATTGSVSLKATQLSASSTRPLVQFDDATANNIISLRGNTTNSELYIKATTDQAQIVAGTISSATKYGLAGAWNTNNCSAAQDGGAAVTDTSVTVPTVTQARLGSDGTNYTSGWLHVIRYWAQRVTDAQVQAFSK